jgi:hypothetical protein
MLRRITLRLAAAAMAMLPLVAGAQLRKLKVIREDGGPIAFANVVVEGGVNQITNDSGEVSFGAGQRATYTVRVMRIGYSPWFGKLELPDTAVTLRVTLPFLTQVLKKVVVADTAHTNISLTMRGFYDRWLMRQKGALSATFIGPEELESRHPSGLTSMMYGVSGLRIVRLGGAPYAMGYEGQCGMAVLLDGIQQGGGGAPSIMGAKAQRNQAPVNLDAIVDANDVAAVEVYARGGNVPSSLHANDSACGVIAIWTGSRKR